MEDTTIGMSPIIPQYMQEFQLTDLNNDGKIDKGEWLQKYGSEENFDE